MPRILGGFQAILTNGATEIISFKIFYSGCRSLRRVVTVLRRVGLLRRQQQALLQEQGRRIGVAQRQPPQRQVQRRDWHLLRVSGGQLEGVTRDAEVWFGGIVLG